MTNVIIEIFSDEIEIESKIRLSLSEIDFISNLMKKEGGHWILKLSETSPKYSIANDFNEVYTSDYIWDLFKK